MGDRRRFVVLPSAFIVWALPGCGGQPDVITLAAVGVGQDEGGVRVAFSPTASTFDDEQAHLGAASPVLQLWIDGQPAMLDDGGGHLSRLTVSEGGQSAVGYLEAGPRHFSVTTTGGAPVFEGDAEVPGGGTLRMFLFGAIGEQRGRFIATPDFPAAGNEHLTVLNLARTGQSLEVVSCTDAATCTALSPALALGDPFDTEVTASSASVGYRVVPSPALPDPPVVALDPSDGSSPAVFIAAPVYIADDGQVQFGFN